MFGINFVLSAGQAKSKHKIRCNTVHEGTSNYQCASKCRSWNYCWKFNCCAKVPTRSRHLIWSDFTCDDLSDTFCVSLIIILLVDYHPILRRVFLLHWLLEDFFVMEMVFKDKIYLILRRGYCIDF